MERVKTLDIILSVVERLVRIISYAGG